MSTEEPKVAEVWKPEDYFTKEEVKEIEAEEQRELKRIEHPGTRFGQGKMNVSLNSGTTYSSVKGLTFATIEELETWCGNTPGHILIWVGNDKAGNVVALVSRELSDDEIQELQEWQADLERMRDERKALKAKAAIEAEEARIKNELEMKRLQQVGRDCEEHHSKVIDENRKLKTSNEDLRKQLKKFEKAAKR